MISIPFLTSKKKLNKKQSDQLDFVLGGIRRDYHYFSGQHYDAGNKGRLEGDWTSQYDTPSQNWKAVYKTVIARSIKSVDNNPHTIAILNELLSNVIGTGLRPQPRVKNKNGELEKTINKELLEGWKRYNDQWDSAGNVTHYEGQSIRFTEIFKTGSTLTNIVKADSNKYLSIQNQMLNILRLDDSHDLQSTGFEDPETANTIFGINLNANGKPLGYWIQGIDRPISSRNMYHSFKTTMAEQYIGIPWLIQALKYLFANEKLIGDQLISSRLQAMIGLYVPNSTFEGLLTKQKDSDNYIEMTSGRIYRGKPGEKPEVVQASNSIKDVLDPLQRLLLHAITMTQGISYQAVTRDLEKTNMASGRINTNEDKKAYRRIQKSFAKSVCQRDWEEFVFRMVVEGKTSINLSTYLKDPWKYNQVQWRGPGYDFIDPKGEASAAIELHSEGMLTLDQHYSEKGLEWRDQIDQWVEEEAYKKEQMEKRGLEVTPKNQNKNQAQTQNKDELSYGNY